MNTPLSVPVLVSACLVGLCTRYSGDGKENAECLNHLKSTIWIPFCPEQLGGLPTPRDAADILDGDGRDVLNGTATVVTKNGQDVTESFLLGAEQTLKIAKSQHITTAIMKARSPSCAVSGKIGVTSALLEKHGLNLLEF